MRELRIINTSGYVYRPITLTPLRFGCVVLKFKIILKFSFLFYYENGMCMPLPLETRTKQTQPVHEFAFFRF